MNKLVKFYLPLIFLLALAIVGIVLIACSPGENKEIRTFDYTACKDTDSIECRTRNTLRKHCNCFIPFELTERVNGAVSLFYELDTFNTTKDNYRQSKDDRQLRGDVSSPPSPSCGDYAYADMPDGTRKPIIPCGAIADTMFNDTFQLNYDGKIVVPNIFTGLEGITEADRANFRNPTGANLDIAKQNYTKPISWPKSIWERNSWEFDDNPDNQGLQNEAFIAWMKTELKTKPVWRVNHTGAVEGGLPAGRYTLRVQYSYPSAMYNGPRRAILRVHISDTNKTMLGFGIFLLIVAIAVSVAIIYLIYKEK